MNHLYYLQILFFAFFFNYTLFAQKEKVKKNDCKQQEFYAQLYKQLEADFEKGNYQAVIEEFERNEVCLEKWASDQIIYQTASLLTEAYRKVRSEEKQNAQLYTVLNWDPFLEGLSPVCDPFIFKNLRREWRIGVLSGQIKSGLNWSFLTQLSDNNSPGVSIIREQYPLKKWRFNGSASISYRPHLFNPWEFGLEYSYIVRHYSYKGNYEINLNNRDFDEASFRFTENMKWDNLFLYAKYNFEWKAFNFRARTSYYVYAGFGISSLQESRLENLEISFSNNALAPNTQDALVISPCPNGGNLRKINNMMTVIGYGGKYKLSPGFFLFIEGRYDFLLNNIVKDETCSELLPFFYQDNNKLLHNVSFLGGIAYQFYMPKRKGENKR